MPDSIVKATIREIEPLSADDPIGVAARRVIDENLPALPAVEAGKFVGIFGEREFMTAVFPGYVGTLHSAAMIRRSIDDFIQLREESAGEEPIRKYLTTDHVLVEDDHSDTQLAELFLHHRVLIIPIATAGRVHAVVTRNDFFRALAARVINPIEDYGT